MKTGCKRLAILLAVIAIITIRAMRPVLGAYEYSQQQIDYCEELEYEIGNLTHILDAMQQKQSKEAREFIKADYIRAIRSVRYMNLYCNIQRDYR